MEKCANDSCITILRSSKKPGEFCDVCERDGKDPIITFPGDIPPARSGRRKGPSFIVSFSREHGGMVF